KNHQIQVLKLAITSRLLLLALILLSRTLINPYDTSASINTYCLTDSQQQQESDSIRWPNLSAKIETSVVWDSVYFVRIAQCGYEYEQSYAFLPLLPITISLLSRTLFAPFVSLIGFRAVVALSAFFLNNLAFLFAAVYFYRLSIIILKDPEAALRASTLFCFNPASIFYSSIYSDALYALFSIGGLYHLASGANNIAVLWFALSGCARSNGVLNAGYFCFQAMHQAYDAVILKRRVYIALQVLVTVALRCICIFVPFIAFQAYGYYNICHGHFPDEARPWCKAKIPLLYNFIQSHYWGVGFLRYFQFKQLPNFLLASPILSLAFFSIAYYVKSRSEIFLSLAFKASIEEKKSAAVFFSLEAVPRADNARVSEKSSSKTQEKHSIRQRKHKIKDLDDASLAVEFESSIKSGFLSASVLPFILHLGFMAATALFVMHVQVATRFLSSSPPLYWFASYLMAIPGKGRRWGYMIWAYSVAYILLGSLLFSNFYPFT
ncbi:Mannosyl_trans2 domain-containing protein, partial [Cephalotus follicularis]